MNSTLPTVRGAMILKYRLWLLISLLVAFALRVHMLSAQSLWNDEGTSVALASLSPEAIINGAAKDIHPPLYYLLLSKWLSVSGNSEFAIRFLSVIAGTLIVATTFKLARYFFDEEVALVAAYLSAFSPFQIYYSQETRMYIWAALWSAVSVYAMARMLEIRSWKLEVGRSNPNPQIPNPKKTQSSNSRTKRTLFWLLYIAATVTALYTHYFAATLVLFENLAFGVYSVIARSRKAATKQSLHSNSETPALACGASVASLPSVARNDTWRHTLAFWLAAQILVGLAFAPWYLFAGNQLASWPAISNPFDLPTLLWRVLNVFSVGLTLEGSLAVSIAVAFAILFFVGWRMERNPHARWGTILLILWTFVPVAVMYLVSLSRPAYNPKFLLLATPPFFILAARGLARIYPGLFLRERYGRFARNPLRYVYFVIAVLATVGFMPSLENYYYNPRYARDNYRAIVRYIEANARAGNGILIDAPGQIDVVRYYYRGTLPLFLLPRMRPPEPNATRADVDEMLSKTEQLYAIFWATEQSDPENIIETSLAEKAFKARETWYGGVRLAVYGVGQKPDLQQVQAKIGNEISLTSFGFASRQARAGDILALTLNWRADRIPTARYKVFVHLLDQDSKLVTQRDAEPMNDLRFTTSWRAGETIPDNYGLLMEPGILPGEYRVEIGMYRADNQARLPIVARDGQAIGDHLVVGTIRVLP